MSCEIFVLVGTRSGLILKLLLYELAITSASWKIFKQKHYFVWLLPCKWVKQIVLTYLYHVTKANSVVDKLSLDNHLVRNLSYVSFFGTLRVNTVSICTVFLFKGLETFCWNKLAIKKKGKKYLWGDFIFPSIELNHRWERWEKVSNSKDSGRLAFLLHLIRLCIPQNISIGRSMKEDSSWSYSSVFALESSASSCGHWRATRLWQPGQMLRQNWVFQDAVISAADKKG